MADSSPLSTPKRKRGVDALPSPIKFSFDLSASRSAEDGSNSPRSKVAHKFHGLALDTYSGASVEDADIADSLRKRIRPDQETCGVLNSVEKPHTAEDAQLNKTTSTSCMGVAGLQAPGSDGYEDKSSFTTPEKTKGKGKKRSGTPPLRFKKGPIMSEPDSDGESDEEMGIVDPVRAALTWHDDEITVYDPEDEDDDGTGINGIGFKPTPALAHARVMKRKQQMAEYRKREESEARARRNERRRGEASAEEEQQSPRKVRFMDAERANIAITTI